jgi:hypothetical protein
LAISATIQGATPLVFEGGTAGDFETSFAITNPSADRTITFPDATLTVNAAANISGATLASNVLTSSLTTVGTIGAGTWQGTAIASAYIAADAITGAKIADDAIDSEHYTDASVDFAHIQNVAANSILGRNANSSGVLSEVALATTQILIGDGTGFTAAALSGDATMTNAGVVTVADDAITLAKMASGTDGNIISFDASGNPVAVATGTDGQVLTSAGAGAPPAFEDAAAGGAISNIQSWYKDSNTTVSSNTATLLSGWSEQSETWYGEIGTAMAESSGIWTFPETGLWKIEFKGKCAGSGSTARFVSAEFYVTTDNSTYAQEASTLTTLAHASGYVAPVVSMLLDVSNVTNVKIKLYTYSQDVSTVISSGSLGSAVTFTRVGVAD